MDIPAGCDVLERMAGGAAVSHFRISPLWSERMAADLEGPGTFSGGSGGDQESARKKSTHLVIITQYDNKHK